MKIIVIDNKEDKVVLLTDLLREAFPTTIVLPVSTWRKQQTFTDWESVYTYLKTIPDSEVVLCMDLALVQEDYNDSMRGLEAGKVIRAKRRDWTLVAFTQFGRVVEPEAGFKEAFDGIIEKGDISNKNRPGRVSYVKNAIESAIRKHKHGKSDFVLPPSAHVKDSLGMRTFRAAFGDSAVAELVHHEAPGWEDMSIAALTTGHSGAFMLSIRGNTSTGPKSLVLKVARNDQIIQDEINAPIKFIDQLGPLTGNFATLDNNKKYLADNVGVYYRQSLVTGPTLLEILSAPDKTAKQRINSLKPVVRLCLDVCESVNLPKAGVADARTVFTLSPIDIGRLETSAEFLRGLGEMLQTKGLWPKNASSPSIVGQGIIDLSDSWKERIPRSPELLIAVQHGDLNPGNIIVRNAGSPVLIDLSRLGHWPIGYDLSRLSLMLRLRLVNTQGYVDWLPDGLDEWLSETVASFGRGTTKSEPICPESLYCDEQFQHFLQGTPKKYRIRLALGYELGSLWDLFKVISYQDVSPYKRLWALLEAWRLGVHLGLIA